MLQHALDEHYAVGHFNLNNLEFTQAILQAAEEERSPVILAVSPGCPDSHLLGDGQNQREHRESDGLY
ncbi:class II fructose-bisphosphate aldolase [Brevibacillus thermoruber]|uniref:class II fructose-bisphosphate aldolase n=1 Tax=Brevibacillus thermoruber TaxID=33942 RepID=UPI003A5C7413